MLKYSIGVVFWRKLNAQKQNEIYKLLYLLLFYFLLSTFFSTFLSRRITFCGITMKNYVEANVSHKSHTTIKYALKMLSSSSETIIFIFLGVATVNNAHEWNTWFVVCTILFCSVFRIIGMSTKSTFLKKKNNFFNLFIKIVFYLSLLSKKKIIDLIYIYFFMYFL